MLHVLTCLFNPVGSTRMVQNYWRFRIAIERTRPVTLTTVELTFDDQQPMIPDAIHIHGESRLHLMWQKERLLNVGLEQLPASAEAIAWIDADILFERPDWAAETLNRLETTPVIQPWSTCRFLDRTYQTHKKFTSLAAKRVQHLGVYGHPGFAWAARRDVFPTGLFDLAVVGSGDSWMGYAFDGTPDAAKLKHNPQMSAAWRDWSVAIERRVQGRLGFVAGAIDHLYHGDWSDRRYHDRQMAARDFMFDPAVHIQIDPSNGLWRWTDPDCPLADWIAAYFPSRNDDGITLSLKD